MSNTVFHVRVRERDKLTGEPVNQDGVWMEEGGTDLCLQKQKLNTETET